MYLERISPIFCWDLSCENNGTGVCKKALYHWSSVVFCQVTARLEQGNQLANWHLKYKKTFDPVNHRRLPTRLSAVNVDEIVIYLNTSLPQRKKLLCSSGRLRILGSIHMQSPSQRLRTRATTVPDVLKLLGDGDKVDVPVVCRRFQDYRRLIFRCYRPGLEAISKWRVNWGFSWT